MLYIIGLGLNEKGVSIEGREAVKKCKRVYLDAYTVDFPYSIHKISELFHKKIIKLPREELESNKLVKEAKKKDIGLLVYGCPLFATTHISLIEACKKLRIKVKVIYSASVFDAIAETGLQLYKFGKISSMPRWEKHFKPYSFAEIVKENFKINAHSLILVDLGLSFGEALQELIEAIKIKKIKLKKILVCSSLGTKKSKIYYAEINKLKNKKIKTPFCFIIPGKLHFMEEEVLKTVSEG